VQDARVLVGEIGTGKGVSGWLEGKWEGTMAFAPGDGLESGKPIEVTDEWWEKRREKLASRVKRRKTA
jgi:hypothetical protein